MVDAQVVGNSSHAEALLAELKKIRKGRGIAESARHDVVGPRLARLCDITNQDRAEEALSKLNRTLSSFLKDLSVLEADAASAALGIGAEFGSDILLGERVKSLAEKLGVDDRTARRRIDHGLAKLAECMSQSVEAAGLPSSLKRGWHARSVRTMVLIGKDGVEVSEFRTIVSKVADLRSINLGVSVPAAHSDMDLPQKRLEIYALYGGDVAQRRIETSARAAFVLEFPRPLALGEVYEYGIRFRLPSTVEMVPYYVVVPYVTCDEFDLRVKFHRIPAKVELLYGVLQADTTDPVLEAPAIEIGPIGEVHAKFKQLQPGLAYGIRWLNN